MARPASLILMVVLAVVCAADAADRVDYVSTDLRALYVFDEPGSIDWATVYYLNDQHACRVDLVTLRRSGGFRVVRVDVPERELYLHTVYATGSEPDLVNRVMSDLYGSRRPDVVIIGEIAESSPTSEFRRQLLELPAAPDMMFDVARTYVYAGERVIAGDDSPAERAAEM